MKASVIIPTCNRADQLFKSMNSLLNIDFDKTQYEIIVVDNGSKDSTKQVVEQCTQEYSDHHIRYFFDDIPGLLTGRHRGAKEALSEILVFVDDDIEADKGWLSAIVDTFSTHPDVHLVGGKCLPKFEKAPPEWLEYFWNLLSGGGKYMGELSLIDLGDEEKVIDPMFVWGLNFSIRKSTLYEFGGFHPDVMPPQYQHLLGDGETGISLNMKVKGYKAYYHPKAKVYHDVPAERMTIAYFDKRYFYQGVCNSYTTVRKNGGIVHIPAQLNILRKATAILKQSFGLNLRTSKKTIQSDAGWEKDMLLTRFQSIQQAGYNFHQEMVRKSPEVLHWVLKENYFDYKLPVQ